MRKRESMNPVAALRGLILLAAILCSAAAPALRAAPTLDIIPDRAEDWSEQGVVLEKGSGDDWDSSEREFKVLDCIQKDGVFYLYYAAGVTNCFVFCSHQCIGLATSTDGRTFTKHPDNPLICPEDMIEVDSWEEGVRHGAVMYNADTRKWIFYVSTDTDKWELAQPGQIPQEDWSCDAGVDGAIHVFTSDDGIAWNLEGVPTGVNNEDGAENHVCAVEYANGTYYVWNNRSNGDRHQHVSSGSDYMNLTFHGKVDGLDFGWAHIKTFLHNDKRTLTYYYWPNEGMGIDLMYFATSSIDNPQEISNERLVFEKNEQTYEIIKDAANLEWKWYYTPFWQGTVKLRTADLDESTVGLRPGSRRNKLNGASRTTLYDITGRAVGGGNLRRGTIHVHNPGMPTGVLISVRAETGRCLKTTGISSY